MGTSAADDRYVAVYDSAQFTTLRRRSNSFVAWASATFYGWWLLVIMLAAFVPEFFRQRIIGPINVGLLAILISFFLVTAVSALCLRYANSRLDPLSEQIRADLEGDLR